VKCSQCGRMWRVNARYGVVARADYEMVKRKKQRMQHAKRVLRKVSEANQHWLPDPDEVVDGAGDDEEVTGS